METKDELIKVILAVMILLLSLIVIRSVFKISNPNSLSNWATTCGNSVEYMVRFSTLMHKIRPDSLHCPTKHFYVNDGGVYYNGTVWMRFENRGKDNKEVIEKALAYDLFSCAKAFKGVKWYDTSYPITFYVVCSEWRFNLTKPVNISDFKEYLINNKVPGTDESFYNYLLSLSCGSYCRGRKDSNKLEIELRNNSYSVVFFYGANKKSLPQSWGWVSALTAPGSGDLKRLMRKINSINNSLFFLDDSAMDATVAKNLDFVAFVPSSRVR